MRQIHSKQALAYPPLPSIHAWHTKRGRQENLSFLPASKKSPKKPSFVGLMCDCLLMDFLGPFGVSFFGRFLLEEGVSSHIRSDYSC